MEFKIKTKYILYMYRNNKEEKLVFSSKLSVLMYELLLKKQKIKYCVLEVLCYE